MPSNDAFTELASSWDRYFRDLGMVYVTDRPVTMTEHAECSAALKAMKPGMPHALPHGLKPMRLEWNCEYCGSRHLMAYQTCCNCGAGR